MVVNMDETSNDYLKQRIIPSTSSGDDVELIETINGLYPPVCNVENNLVHNHITIVNENVLNNNNNNGIIRPNDQTLSTEQMKQVDRNKSVENDEVRLRDRKDLGLVTDTADYRLSAIYSELAVLVDSALVDCSSSEDGSTSELEPQALDYLSTMAENQLEDCETSILDKGVLSDASNEKDVLSDEPSDEQQKFPDNADLESIPQVDNDSNQTLSNNKDGLCSDVTFELNESLDVTDLANANRIENEYENCKNLKSQNTENVYENLSDAISCQINDIDLATNLEIKDKFDNNLSKSNCDINLDLTQNNENSSLEGLDNAKETIKVIGNDNDNDLKDNSNLSNSSTSQDFDSNLNSNKGVVIEINSNSEVEIVHILGHGCDSNDEISYDTESQPIPVQGSTETVLLNGPVSEAINVSIKNNDTSNSDCLNIININDINVNDNNVFDNNDVIILNTYEDQSNSETTQSTDASTLTKDLDVSRQNFLRAQVEEENCENEDQSSEDEKSNVPDEDTPQITTENVTPSEDCTSNDYEYICDPSVPSEDSTSVKEDDNHYSELQGSQLDSGEYSYIKEDDDDAVKTNQEVIESEPIYAEIKPRLPPFEKDEKEQNENKNQPLYINTQSSSESIATPSTPTTPTPPVVSTESSSPSPLSSAKEKLGFRIRGHKKVIPKTVIKMRRARNSLARVGLYSVPGPPEPIYETVEEASGDSSSRSFTDPHSNYTVPKSG